MVGVCLEEDVGRLSTMFAAMKWGAWEVPPCGHPFVGGSLIFI